jgi:hypothetical protein
MSIRYIDSKIIPCDCSNEMFNLILQQPFAPNQINFDWWHRFSPYVIELVRVKINNDVKVYLDIHCPTCKNKANNVFRALFDAL